jgi:hypothetical protein
MFCKHCGQRIGRSEMFCVRCGQTISQEEFETAASHAESPKATTSVAELPEPATTRAGSVFDPEPETGNAIIDVEPAQFPSRSQQLTPAPVSREPRYVPVRKNSFPIIEFLVAVLLVAGAVAALWIFHSTIQSRGLIQPAIVGVTIAPATAKVRAGKSAEFAATVSGSDNNEVNWSIEENETAGTVVTKGARAVAGQVSSLATYTAPRTSGIYHLRASSKASPESSATAVITVRK